MGFEWSGALATGISWLLTFSAVCIGYIFFRSESVKQAFAMLKAMLSLHTYNHRTLDRSLYLMTFLAAAGYFAVIAGGALLDRLGGYARSRSDGTSSALRKLTGRWLGTFADERWVWITPVVLVLTLYLSVVFQPGHAETGPIMYALF